MGLPERQKKKNFATKGSNAVSPGMLTEQRIEQIPKDSKPAAIWGRPSLEAERQARDSQRQKARACCSPDPRHRIFHQTLNRLPFANHVFLESWTVDICQEWHSLRSAPQRRKHASHPGLCS